MSFTQKQLDQVEIQSHQSGDVVWIDNFVVPDRLRRNKLGSAAYLAWEGKLPPNIKLVRLFAADTGSGRSNHFWDYLGFCYRYFYNEAHNNEIRFEMHKGVNGHKTPKPSK